MSSLGIRGSGRFESAGQICKSDAEAAVDHGGVAMAGSAATGVNQRGAIGKLLNSLDGIK